MATAALPDVHPSLKDFLSRPLHKLLIDGKASDAASGKTFKTLNPATGEELGPVAEADTADVDRAVAAGCKSVYLDTVPEAMPEAHRLYLDLGFEPCAPYNDNPVEGLAYLRKNL